MTTIIQGGSIPAAGYIEDVFTYTVMPENGAEISELTYVWRKSSRPIFTLGDQTPYGQIVEIRRPTHIGADVYRQVIEAAFMPASYSIPQQVTHTFPGKSPAEAFDQSNRRFGPIRPFTVTVVGRLYVTFLSQFAALRFTPDVIESPTYDGEVVDFYGPVYERGVQVGVTSPPTPPSGYQTISDTIRPWRGQIWMRERTQVRRPRRT